SYVFKNESNGYTIAKLETNDKELISIVGYFPLLSEELEYEFTGEETIHPKLGRQLTVKSYERLENTSESGLVRYLSSDNFSGIGPVTAEKIVSLLGTDAIEKIITDENVLSPILNPIKRNRLKKELISHQAEQRIFVKLLDLGLTTRISAKLFSNYGSQTLEKLEEDPYRLMYEIDGFGFIKSRDIAEKFGIAKDDIRSLKAALVYSLITSSNGDGNLYLYEAELMHKVSKILDVDANYKDAIEALILEKKIVLEDDKYFLKQIYKDEMDIAKRI